MPAPSNKRHVIPACLVLAALVAVLGHAFQGESWAQEQAMTGPEILARLADDSFARREQATQALLKVTDPDLEQLGALYQQAQLPEQRHRLRAVIEHHVMARLITERFDKPSAGAIGIRHARVTAGGNDEVITVLVTYPGLPGYVHLRVGDLILGMDGQEITARRDQPLADAFVERIQTKRMGDSISLKVLREGETVTETFKLGSAQALNDIYNNRAMGFNTSAVVFAQRRRALQKILGGGEHQPAQLNVTLPKINDDESQDDQGADAGHQNGRQRLIVVEGRDQVQQAADALQRRLKIRINADRLEIQTPRNPAADIQQLLDEIDKLQFAPNDQ